MLIGVMSDTHGHIDTASNAVQLLQRKAAAYVIHCGDVGGPRVLDLLVGIPSAFVWGNCDYDRYDLKQYAGIVGVACYGAMGRLTLGGKDIRFLHGDDYRQMRSIIEAQDCDFVFSGHTHHAKVEDVGRIRTVNPGALSRAQTKTVALVDTDGGDVEFLEVG